MSAALLGGGGVLGWKWFCMAIGGQQVAARLRQGRHTPTCLAFLCRWLWLAAQEPAWSPATHSRFLPSFQAAARTLLLAAKRGSCSALGSDSQTALQQLGALPPAALQRVLGLAAYPLSAWAQLDS